jgi:hypothetical protein
MVSSNNLILITILPCEFGRYMHGKLKMCNSACQRIKSDNESILKGAEDTVLPSRIIWLPVFVHHILFPAESSVSETGSVSALV